MNEEQLVAAYAYLSPNISPPFLVSEVLPAIKGADHLMWVDPMSPEILQYLDLPRTVSIVYNGHEAITTLSHRVYRTTSLWWLIVMCSGYLHPHQIPNNSSILIPTLKDVLPLIKQQQDNSLVGQVITF